MKSMNLDEISDLKINKIDNIITITVPCIDFEQALALQQYKLNEEITTRTAKAIQQNTCWKTVKFDIGDFEGKKYYLHSQNYFFLSTSKSMIFNASRQKKKRHSLILKINFFLFDLRRCDYVRHTN